MAVEAGHDGVGILTIEQLPPLWFSVVGDHDASLSLTFAVP